MPDSGRMRTILQFVRNRRGLTVLREVFCAARRFYLGCVQGFRSVPLRRGPNVRSISGLNELWASSAPDSDDMRRILFQRDDQTWTLRHPALLAPRPTMRPEGGRVQVF